MSMCISHSCHGGVSRVSAFSFLNRGQRALLYTDSPCVAIGWYGAKEALRSSPPYAQSTKAPNPAQIPLPSFIYVFRRLAVRNAWEGPSISARRDLIYISGIRPYRRETRISPCKSLRTTDTLGPPPPSAYVRLRARRGN